ncbi:hypothetical protein Afil01_30180 [Actinorhabdospora filicis]|uniref:DUF218 domain-containing protein n=1 Tax=Actinorhabdospora filicis TaxID=1785913 RepID=A0A9W6SLW6_9ACTN|nr:YdcF family protein [Actinorhabdospora filicis]GLZ78211.1 hypothetical protein Afil01_30180 [Actinorhabdospora filicis]
MTGDLTPERIDRMTAFVDITAPPPAGSPVAVFIFGTNQIAPIEIAAERYAAGLAPLIIVTGGINRHDGRVEGPWLRGELAARGVPADGIRVESTSANTEQNVINARPFILEAIDAGLPLVAVSKWYHRRAINALATHAPELGRWYAIGYEPIYAGRAITRENWPTHPDGLKRVVRESGEVPRRIADGTLADATIEDGAWRHV